MRINFNEHQFRGEGKYKCECGNRFKRVATSSWTENPFNKNWMAGRLELCDQNCKDQIKKTLSEKKCPKCDNVCKNLNN